MSEVQTLVGKLAGKLAGCTGKLQYGSKAAALRVAKRMKADVHVYKCPYCKAFHIGRPS